MFGFPPILDGNAGVKMTLDADSGFPKSGIREIFYSIKDGNWTDTTVWQTASGRVGLLPSANDDVYVRHTITLNVTTTINNLITSFFSTFTINATFTLGINGQIINNVNTSIINRGTINFLTQKAAETSLFNGTFDILSNANTIGYTGDYTCTIPLVLSTFHNLTISGTGTKTLGVNTTLNGGLGIANSSILECSTFNLSVLGTSTIGSGVSNNTTYLSKNASGNIVFTGLVTLANSGRGFDFSGNPNVEFKGGLSTTNQATGVTPNTGTGTWRFTTNNQTWSSAGTAFANMNAAILIDGITLTINQISLVRTMNINNTIDGTNSSSNLVMTSTAGAYLSFAFNSISYYTPMSTFGTFNPSGGGIEYNFNGSITLPSTNYGLLVIGGTGTKTLGNNTVIGGGGLSITAGATLECSTFDLTVNGSTILSSGNPTLRKSGIGNLLFVGILQGNNSIINFSGNPNIEFRGGFSFANATFTSGTGTYTFSTANQNLDAQNSTLTFNGNVIISNVIVTQANGAGATFTNTVIFVGTLNGTTAGSTYRVGSNGAGTPLTTNYQNTTQPMATGVLDTSTNLNTFIYGAGNQDVKGNPTVGQTQQYRNLRFSGSGTTKRLLGNINVQNTYTVDAGVTVNLNGYTKTP